MATETTPSHQTPTSDHESIENKVTEELKPVEPETVSVAKKTEEKEEDSKPNEVAIQSTPLPKSEGEVEDKEAEPPAVEVKKIDDVPVVDVPVDDNKELEKESICVLDPVADVVNGKPVAPAIESVPKEAEELELSTSVEELRQEQPNMVDVPVSSDEAIEKPQEPSEVLPIKESEPIEAKDTEDSAMSKGVDKPESVIPEAEVKPEEQSEVGKQVEEPKTDAAVEKPEEPLEVLPIKSEPVEVKDSEDSEPVPKVDDKPESVSTVPEVEVKWEEQSEVVKKIEPEVKSVEVIVEPQEPVEVLPIKGSEAVVPEPKEAKLESEVTKHVEKTKEQSVEAIEKTQESSEVHPSKESEAVVVKDIDVPVAVPDVDKPESVVPEVEVKQEEQSEVTKQIGKPEPVVPEVEVKLEEQPDLTKQVEKPEELEVKAKPEGQSEVGEQVEIMPTDENSGQVAAITQEAQAEIIEDGGKSSLPEIVEKAGPEDENKEAEVTDLVELPSKEVALEVEKGGEEKEAKTTEADEEKIASDTLKEELAQPIKAENVSNAISNAEVTGKSFEGEKTVESAERAVENKKEEIPPIDETKKDGNIEGKPEAATTIVSEPVKEFQDSALEAKEEETVKTNEENSEQEKVDEIAKSDSAQNLDSSTKDAEDTKVSQDLPREIPTKSTQKQSNNILTKVKQSLVKAKKAIIGKSPTPKTVSSDAKGEVKVNN